MPEASARKAERYAGGHRGGEAVAPREGREPLARPEGVHVASRAEPARSREEQRLCREARFVDSLAASLCPKKGPTIVRLDGALARCEDGIRRQVFARVREPAGHAYIEHISLKYSLEPSDRQLVRQVDNRGRRPAGRDEVVPALGILYAIALGRGLRVKTSLRIEERRDAAEEAD